MCTPPERISTWGIIRKISRNRLRHELECLGYRTVAFETGAVGSEWEGTDYFYSRNSGPFAGRSLLRGVSRFEARLLDATFAQAFLDALRQSEVAGQPAMIDPLDDVRERILFAFDELDRVPALPSPRLVFVHILSPHPPMVFARNQSRSTPRSLEQPWGGGRHSTAAGRVQ
ncbi:MAG: hypothetical protein MUO23_06305 [Anaerolineales bacterium]|nr:hypothetical protein [Anaerolineales bacterium]